MPETSVTSVDLINYALENNPTKMGDAFNNIVMQKVADAVAVRKQELAQSMFDSAEDEVDSEEQQEVEDETNTDEDEQQDDENEDGQDEDTQTDA